MTTSIRHLCFVVALALALPIADAAIVSDAAAQNTERRGFFEMLFGRPAQPNARRERQRQQRPQVRRVPRQSAPAAPPVPTAEVLPKDEGALKILVIGDFVSGAVARGLVEAFAEEPRVAIVNASNGNSGIVRDDYYDWGGILPDMLNNEKPDVVVMAIGGNDRQQIKANGSRYAPLSSEWEEVYSERVAAISDTLKVFGQPFFWVGAPPMRSSSFSRDMAYLNGIFKGRVTEADGYYIDIWNGFADADGRYVSSGPDVDGNLRALRTKDGINFTRAGRRKLAFYVERELKRQTGLGAGSADVLLVTSPSSQIEIGPDGQKWLVGPVISLSGAPRPGARDVLAGAPEAETDAAEAGEETPHVQMVVKGKTLPRVAGRADDFTWPPPTAPEPAEEQPGEVSATEEASDG